MEAATALSPATLLTALNILVAIFGVLIVVVTIYEYTKLAGLRRDFNQFREEWRAELFRSEKAMQRVIASYSAEDTNRKIELLESAVELDPTVFNGYNALGYAYLENGDHAAALDAFQKAIHQNPQAIEGYCDLARLFAQQGDSTRARKYLKAGKKVDPEGLEGLRGDPLMEPLIEDV
jgi:tetratricopeptide (TPR) repeat protein